jgi:hypothetical protein
MNGEGFSDVDFNNEYSQKLSADLNHKDLKYTSDYLGFVMREKKKITLKDVKRLIACDNEDPQVLHCNDIKFVASNCGITRDAFKYCRQHKIYILEIGKMNDNNVYILFDPFKDNKLNKKIKY